jgi:hypothetical protein
MLIDLLRSLQLSRKKREGGLYWPGPQQLPVHTLQITMEIYISDWINKFQNKTGLDAKANLELYKSKRVCSARNHSPVRLSNQRIVPSPDYAVVIGLDQTLPL